MVTCAYKRSCFVFLSHDHRVTLFDAGILRSYLMFNKSARTATGTQHQRTWFFFYLFIFNWKIIALQYCVDFYQTLTWTSHRFTHVPSYLNIPHISHPTPRGYQTRSEFPESYSKFPLAIYFTFGNVYVSVLFAQIIPPSSPRVQNSVVYVCVSFAVLHIRWLVASF